jgi:hypothetical protein
MGEAHPCFSGILFLWATAHHLKGLEMTTGTTTEKTGSEIKEIEIKSMFIECREWFDKTGGNSYFSARIWVNGKWEITLPFQYGYEDHFKSVAVRALVEKGFIPKELENRALWVIAEQMKFDCYTSKAYTTKKEMFKETN